MWAGDRARVGRICGPFGVKGWVKVYSYTEPRDNILGYSPWHLTPGHGERIFEVIGGHNHCGALVAMLEGIDDRDAAARLLGADIEVDSALFEPPEAGQYYWAHLLGLKVVDLEARELGAVDHLLRTAAHDVLVLSGERQRLIPFVQGAIVAEVDLQAGVIRVDWDADY